MFIKKSQILLFCMCSLVVFSVAAMEKDGKEDADAKGSLSPQVASRTVMPLADPAHPKKQYLAGVELTTSIIGIPPVLCIPRLEEAVALFTASAAGGCQKAKEILPLWQYNLGITLRNIGISLNPKDRLPRLRAALNMLTLSAKGGHQTARDNLSGVYYDLGLQLTESTEGLAPDKEVPILREAVQWITKASTAKEVYNRQLYAAQYNLALALTKWSKLDSSNVLSLFREAVENLTQSAEGGLKEAKAFVSLWQYNLGCLLANSAEGAVPSKQVSILREAVQWLTKCSSAGEAFKQGLSAAQCSLAIALRDWAFTLGLPEQTPTLREAINLLEINAKGDIQKAKDLLPKLQHELGCLLADSAEGLAPEIQMPILNEAIEWLTASANGGNTYAKKELPRQYIRLGIATANTAEALSPDQQVPLLKEAVNIFSANIILAPAFQGDQHLKTQFSQIRCNLAVALYNCSKLDSSNELSLFREAVENLTQSAEGGLKEAIDLLPAWQQYLGCILANSVEGLTPDSQLPILREVVQWLTKCSKAKEVYKRELYVAQYNLAVVLREFAYVVDITKKIPALREAVSLLTICAEGGFQPAIDSINSTRMVLANRLYERSGTLDLAPAIDHLLEAKDLLRVCLSSGDNNYANELLCIIHAVLMLKSSQLKQ